MLEQGNSKEQEQALLSVLQKKAASYVPEWQLDFEHPDVGTTLATIYTRLYSDTLSRLQRVKLKHTVAFFQALDADLLPALPARGVVQFQLSTGEFGGTDVPRGCFLLGNGSEEGQVGYETVEDVYVTPAELETILFENGDEDRIVRVKDKKGQGFPFVLLSPAGENLQQHSFSLQERHVLELLHDSWIKLELEECKLEAFGQDKSWVAQEVSYCYWNAQEEEYIPFEEVVWKDNALWLHKGQKQPPLFPDSVEEPVICRYQGGYHRKPLRVGGLKLSAKGTKQKPDFLQTQEGEQGEGRFYPFGARPVPYAEMYFGAREALSKVGARITLEFFLELEEIPLQVLSKEAELQLKNIMKNSDFFQEQEYELTVSRVMWEYYNGLGWTRLDLDPSAETLFAPVDEKHHARKVELSFDCPPDVECLPLFSAETRYIRVRVLNVSNLYRIRGSYITPAISEIRFSYDYPQGAGQIPEVLVCRNNLALERKRRKELEQENLAQTLLAPLQQKGAALYLGFSMPLEQGPLRMFASVEGRSRRKMPRLLIEYSSTEGFAPLFVQDETEGFQKNGQLTFMGRKDFEKKELFGEKSYWLRITDPTESYCKAGMVEEMPILHNLQLNTAKILAVESLPERYFPVEKDKAGQTYTLDEGGIYDAEVWVDETDSISAWEQERLFMQGNAFTERNNENSRTWVLWRQSKRMSLESGDSRCYELNANQGTIRFGDGVCGRIPPRAGADCVRVRGRKGGGLAGNQAIGEISTLGESYGYVSKVSNLMPTTGGCDKETLDHALKRNAAAIRHGGRAVTASDFEALVREADRSIQAVRCFTGRDEHGNREKGAVTVVVIPAQAEQAADSFEDCRERIVRYIEPCLPLNLRSQGKFHVTQPLYVKVVCRIDVTVGSFQYGMEVRSRIAQRLDTVLDPIHGNYKHRGWKIGSLPTQMQILNAIKEIPAVRQIKRLQVSAVAENGEEIELTGRREGKRLYAIPLSGEHIINVELDEGSNDFFRQGWR